jgi:hypothetical protein
MKVQDWIFSVRYAPEGVRDLPRHAVVGPGRASTVEAALHLAGVPEPVRAEIRADPTVRSFVDGQLDPDRTGYYVPCPCPASTTWLVCIGPIHAVIDGGR